MRGSGWAAGLAFVSLLACAPLGSAQESASQRSTITVTGDATITAVSDQARIEFGVVTQARDAKTAASNNATQVERLIAALRKALPQGARVETVVYSLNPDYRYPERGGQPTIQGYTATNIVRATTDDLDQVGTVIDAAIQAGANHVQSLQFTLRDENEVRGRALREAAARARQKGDALASALGVSVVRVFQVREEATQPIRPFDTMMQAKLETGAAANTPIEPGRIEVEARVTLVLEIRS